MVPHSFFCSVLPSEVLSSSPQLLKCAALWLCLIAEWSAERTLVDFEDTLVDFPTGVALSRHCNADPSEVWPEPAVSFFKAKDDYTLLS